MSAADSRRLTVRVCCPDQKNRRDTDYSPPHVIAAGTHRCPLTDVALARVFTT